LGILNRRGWSLLAGLIPLLFIGSWLVFSRFSTSQDAIASDVLPPVRQSAFTNTNHDVAYVGAQAFLSQSPIISPSPI